MELKSLLDPEVIDLVAKKHWERKSHPMMEKAGYATDWINLSKSLKREYRNIAIRIIKTAFSAAEITGKPDDGFYSTQDPKYGIKDNRFVNMASGEFIPKDEPVFLFRARDIHAADVIGEYGLWCSNEEHCEAVKLRVNEFNQFRVDHSERMKEPDTEKL